VEYTSAEAVDVVAAKDPHFEATASPHLDGLEVAPDPHLEPTLHAKVPSDTIASFDPALVTDPSELVKEFPTRFGVANSEVVRVGMASDYPELYADAAISRNTSGAEDEELEAVVPAEAPHEHRSAQVATNSSTSAPSKAAWMAEEAPLEAHENRVQLHNEMKEVFAGAPPAEPEVEVELVEPDAEAADAQGAEVGSAADPELAAAMAAAVGAEITPAVTHLVMESKVSNDTAENHTALAADIVHRVTEMMKPELIKRIAAELSKKK
jgi:hypothetical protein